MQKLQTADAAALPSGWPTAGRSGLVPVELLIENPHNPRKYFDPAELDELTDLIKDGGQREVITVRELTYEEGVEYPDALYMVVSGARRLRALKKAGIQQAEIRVRVYHNESAEALDAFLLNESRVGLSDYEVMHDVRRLADLHGWVTDQKISRCTGIQAVTVGKLLTVHREASLEVLALMEPSRPDKKRLRLDVAFAFTRFDLETQDELVKKMPPQLESSAAQITWLKKEADARGVTFPTRKRNPREVRRLVTVLADVVYRKARAIVGSADIHSITENAKPREMDALLQDLGAAIEKLVMLKDKVQRIVDKSVSVKDVKPVVAVVVPKTPLMSPLVPPKPSLPVATPRPQSTPAPKAGVVSSGRLAPPPVVKRHPSPSPPKAVVPVKRGSGISGFVAQWQGLSSRVVLNTEKGWQKPKTITCDVWNDQAGRCTLQTLTLVQYKGAHDRGELKFQQEGQPRPEWLPDPETLG